MNLRLLLVCSITAILPAIASGSENEVPENTAAGIKFFETKIRPLLVKHCYECHSVESGVANGELRLDSRGAIRKGGDRGPAIVPGDPDTSWLLTAVSHADADLKMPPKRERLPSEAIADLKNWIEMGAPDPRLDEPAAGKPAWEKASRDFWAYRVPQASSLPPVKDSNWSKSSIDHFILSKLEEHDLHPSADAEPQVLLRRLHFDLIGLPPSP